MTPSMLAKLGLAILGQIVYVFLDNTLSVRQLARLTCSCAGVWLLAGGLQA